MMSNWPSRVGRAIVGVLTVIATTSTAIIAQAVVKFETYTAATVNMSVGGGENLKINVVRWSTDEDRDRLVSVLKEKGDTHLLDAIAAATSTAGYVWGEETLGYTLRYAYWQRLPDGGERVILLTDRPLGSWTGHPWQAKNQAGPVDYPFTLIELRLNASGVGQGKMSLTTKVTADETAHTIALENFETAPLLLNRVKHQPSAEHTDGGPHGTP